MGAARSFLGTAHGINSLNNSPPPGSQYDQSPAYVFYFHFAHIHIIIVLRLERPDDPGFSGSRRAQNTGLTTAHCILRRLLRATPDTSAAGP
jgi:hypothetical protein